MLDIANKRCFHHAGREAVARCPGCGRFYCRECVTDHQGKVLCASCLSRGSEQAHEGAGLRVKLFRFVQVMVSVALLWFVFYVLGRSLLLLPSVFHKGTLWKVPFMEGG